jgi:hypothetical protein
MSRAGRSMALCFCLIALPAAAGPPASSWGLPYHARPLHQEGSENLLPPMMGDPRSGVWRLRGGASVVPAGGEPIVRLSPGDGFSVSVPVTGGRLYTVELQFAFAPDTTFAPTADEIGLNGWVEPLAPGACDHGAYPIGEVRVLPGWQQHRSFFYAEREVNEARLSLGLTAATGSVSVRRTSVREVAAGAEAGLSVVSTGRDEWAELPRAPEPAAPDAAVFYSRRDPDRLFPYSAPSERELTQPIALRGTPGEVLIAAAGLFAPTTVEKVTLSLSDLTSADGHVLGAELEWFEVCYRPRKTNYYGRGRTFQLVADSLRSRPRGITAAAGRTTVFWLRFAVPPSAPPGSYRGMLTAHAPAVSYALPVEVRVLPFALVEVPSRTWGLYADSDRWTGRTDEQVRRELLDMKAHGIESLLIDVDLGAAIWDGARVAGWRLSADVDRFVGLIRSAGLRGPLIVEWWQIEDAFARHLGLSPEAMERHADTWPPELAAAYRDALRAFDQQWKARGWGEWVYSGLDEPGSWKPGSPELFRFQYDAAAAAGVPSYCTSGDLPSDAIGRPLTYHCVDSRFAASPGIAEQFLREAHERGQHVWYYASGSYDAQVGRLTPNRWITGFLLCRTGAEGAYSWTYQRPHGPDPFDDFHRREIQPCVTYPDPEHPGENLDTPHWEAIRQGWYDYRYAATLARAIDRAKQRPATRTRGAKVEGEFTRLLASLPWSADPLPAPAGAISACDAWRQQVADLILQLDG